MTVSSYQKKKRNRYRNFGHFLVVSILFFSGCQYKKSFVLGFSPKESKNCVMCIEVSSKRWLGRKCDIVSSNKAKRQRWGGVDKFNGHCIEPVRLINTIPSENLLLQQQGLHKNWVYCLISESTVVDCSYSCFIVTTAGETMPHTRPGKI